MQIWKKTKFLQIQDGGRAPYWLSFFWLYLGALLADQCEIRKGDEESHANTGHMIKTAIFQNSRWRTAANLKIDLSPYLSRELSDFDQIWYTQMQISIPSMEIWQKIENFQIQDSQRTPYWLSFFGYISAPYWPINAKFGNEMKDHMLYIGHVTKTAIFANSRWRTAAVLKIALSPYLSRELSDFNQIWSADAHFHSQRCIFLTNRNFSNWRWQMDAILKKVLWLYLGAILADLCKIWTGNKESHANTGHMTKTAIFENSRWRTDAILKIALSPYFRCELSDFDQIWYIYANFHSEHGNLTKNRNFSNSRWRMDAILKLVFLAISRHLIGRLTQNSEYRWRTTCQFRSHDQNCNFLKFKMADGRHFENSFRCLRHSCNESMLFSVFQ